jgi:2-C-methyl-D-erythritol 2,4-cyclodiphosphate synthase
MPETTRVGLGFDVHPWAEDRTLMLAGVRIDGEAGLRGHSDGDAASHALADALLGAAALGDIGDHVPESDPAIAGIPGTEILARCVQMLADAGYVPGSCDLTIVCERPSIAPLRSAMRAALADALGVGIDAVSVKATRPEGLGLQGDGVGCLVVAMVVPAAGSR